MKRLSKCITNLLSLAIILFTMIFYSCKKDEVVTYIDISGLWKSVSLNTVSRIENSPKAILFYSPDNSGYLYCSEVSTNKYSFGGMGYIEVINKNQIKVSGEIYNKVDYTINTSLDDYWIRDDDGIEIHISGVSGVFSNIPSSTAWSIMVDEGLISSNSFKLKAISTLFEYQWSCQELWWHETNGYPDEVDWAKGTITMSNDGKSICIKSTNPWDYTTLTSIYHRKS